MHTADGKGLRHRLSFLRVRVAERHLIGSMRTEVPLARLARGGTASVGCDRETRKES